MELCQNQIEWLPLLDKSTRRLAKLISVSLIVVAQT